MVQLQSRVEKRRALFAANQAKLTEEELAIQKLQNQAWSERARTANTIYALRCAKRWFIEFMEDVYPEVDAAAKYFTNGAPPPAMELLKEYARYLTRSRTGSLNEKLSVKTLTHYMSMIISVMELDCRYEPQLLLRSQVNNFIHEALKQQEGIKNAMHIKAVAHTEDVTFILSKLYTPEYLNRFPDMRTVLNLTLYIVLVVDLCGRGCEIARNPSRPVHQCLRWEDIEFYTFQSIEDNKFDIRANIKVNWSKGQSLDESCYRTVPLVSLLPTSMALEDTLRLLLILGLMDGIFDYGVTTWKDLTTLRLPPHIAKTGRRVGVKKEFLSVPVLRRMTKHQLTTDPVLTTEMQGHIRKLGLYCGLKDRLIAYCFRRGVAYTLSTQTTTDNQRFCMGQKPEAKAFFTYKSMISTINFAAMFRMLDNEPVRDQSSITLNRSDDAPVRLSEEGEELILHDKDVQSLTAQQEEVRAAILKTHSSLTVAAKAGDPLSANFKSISESRVSLINKLRKKLFQSEYRQHFVDLASRPSMIPDAEAQGKGVNGKEKPVSLGNTVSGTFNSANAVDTELDIMTDSMVDLSLIDKAAWGEAMKLEEERIGELTLSHMDDPMDVDAEPATEIVQETTSPGVRLETDDPSMALHGAPDREIGKGVGRIKLKGASAYNDMLADMTRVGEDQVGLYAVMSSWFKVSHGIDTFWAGQEPLPGTYSCRFCGLDLTTVHHPDEHSFNCAQKDALQRASAFRDWIFPLNRPCQYQFCGHGDQLFEFVTCGKTFQNIKDQGDHMRNHMRSMQKNGLDGGKVPTCFFGNCALNPEGGRIHRDGPDFDSHDDFLDHLWGVHQIYTVKTNEVKFCEWCQTWLIEPLEWRSHAARHLNDAHDAIAKYGYTGVTVGRAIVPRICPFCFHDEEEHPQKRVATYTSFFDLSSHISIHLREQEKEQSERPCPCFPTMCTKEGKMDADQLRYHLKAVHGIEPKAKKSAKRQATDDNSALRRTRAKKN